MKQLTQEQIKILEDAFASYPENCPVPSKYATMKGIQEQLNELDEKFNIVMYISEARFNDDGGYGFTMEKLTLGEIK